MNKRLLIGLASAGIVGGATFGFAATLEVDSSNLGAGGETVASCDTDGVDVTYDVAYDPTGYEVTNINVADIAAACAGDDLSVTLSDSDDLELTTEVQEPISATSHVLTVTDDVLAEAVEGVDVVINGNAVVVNP
jgi:hypothetical protein